jgi:hypothetical protein
MTEPLVKTVGWLQFGSPKAGSRAIWLTNVQRKHHNLQLTFVGGPYKAGADNAWVNLTASESLQFIKQVTNKITMVDLADSEELCKSIDQLAQMVKYVRKHRTTEQPNTDE